MDSSVYDRQDWKNLKGTPALSSGKKTDFHYLNGVKMALITNVKIEKLNGTLDIEFDIVKKNCVIVGPNGSGKSTALQIIAYALGRQWKALGNLRFASLTLQLDKSKYAYISREACIQFSRAATIDPRSMQINRYLNSPEKAEAFISADLLQSSVAEEYMKLTFLPANELKRAQRMIRNMSGEKSAQKEILDFQSQLQAANIPTTLYLPTYRRIELELKRMIGEMPDYMRVQAASSIKTGISTEFIVELVKFGMEDVTVAIQLFERKYPPL